MADKSDTTRSKDGKITKSQHARLRELEKEKAKILAQVPRKQLHGFVEFIREKGVVGLAIGLAIGTAASGLVTQIVNAVITPTINLLIGKEGLKGLNTIVHVGSHEALYKFGDLIDALIKFIAIAAVVYFVVLGLKLDRLDKKKDDVK